MAFADVQSIPKIGSVRSARHDFLEIAEGLDAVFVHWGGSVYAYDALKQRNVDDIDGMTYSNTYFYRDRTRNVGMEHTGCTDGERLAKAFERLNLRSEANQANRAPFVFAQEGKLEAFPAAHVKAWPSPSQMLINIRSGMMRPPGIIRTS